MTNPHTLHGVESVQFTCDDKWLVTVGGSHSNQSVCVWDWKNSPGRKVWYNKAKYFTKKIKSMLTKRA